MPFYREEQNSLLYKRALNLFELSAKFMVESVQSWRYPSSCWSQCIEYNHAGTYLEKMLIITNSYTLSRSSVKPLFWRLFFHAVVSRVDKMTGLVQRSMDGRQTRCFIMSGEIHQCSLRLRDCFSNMRTFWETLQNKLAVKYKLILMRSCRGLYDTSEMEIGLAIKVNLQICCISSQQLYMAIKNMANSL